MWEKTQEDGYQVSGEQGVGARGKPREAENHAVACEEFCEAPGRFSGRFGGGFSIFGSIRYSYAPVIESSSKTSKIKKN